MLKRALPVACVAAWLFAAGPAALREPHLLAATVPAQAPSAQPAQPDPQQTLDNDTTLRMFLNGLETIVMRADVDGFVSLEGPLGNRDDAAEFARMEFLPGATRVVIQERERQELSVSGIPGSVFGLTVDAFIERGEQARVATWQLYLRRAGNSWGLIRQQLVSSVDNLYKLSLNTTRQYDARNLVIKSEDLVLTLTEGTVFSIDTTQGVTGLVLTGRGEMRFAPAPETEKGQVRIFSGDEVLTTRFDGAFVRVGNIDAHYDPSALVERPVDRGDARKAQEIFDEESPKSFAVDLADLTRDTWTLLPGYDDFLAEVRTRRFRTLTYARSASEPEDISLFERRRKRNIALYPSKSKLETRGRFYNEDDLAGYDVLDYDLDVTSLPDRQWLEGRAVMHLKVKAASLGQLTIRLADTLGVRSIVSDRFGRMFNLRVSNQNMVLVNLPSLLVKDTELTLTILYGGRLEPQSPDRETLGVSQDGQDSGFGSQQPDFPTDMSIPRAEPSHLYSNRSYWYPQSLVSDYATARIRLTVPLVYGCVASGEREGPPQVVLGDSPEESRHVYVFNATRPARYLSFIVSRFVTADTLDVTFGSPDAGSGDAAAEGSAAPLRSLQLSVEANPRQTRQGRQASLRAEDIIRFYRSVIGDLPYQSFTVALVENTLPGGHSPPYFAQLNQPLPNSPFTWRNDPAAFDNYPEFFVAHEVAHQWWGHGVGWQNYHEQWISEGFAQYFAALYARDHRGDEVFQNVLRRMRRWAMNESDQGPVYLGYRVGHIKNDGKAFRAIVYDKAAMALHMLRQLVGDDAFFGGVRRFYVSSRYRKVGSEDFRLAMEQESGRDLRRFFERWIYGSTLPTIAFSYRVESGPGGQVAVLRFEQTGEIFDIPALVTLEYADGHSADVLVKVTDRTVEMPVPLEGALKKASISKQDVGLADYD
jgi:hypothetical protein